MLRDGHFFPPYFIRKQSSSIVNVDVMEAVRVNGRSGLAFRRILRDVRLILKTREGQEKKNEGEI